MKELIFVRHAKSDWGSEFIKDIDRPLAERGYNDAYFMSKWFLKNKKAPDIILSSTATRALNTALIFARTLEFKMSNFFINEKIYESSVLNLISIIQDQGPGVKTVMLFGHNPGITETCNLLTDDLFFDNLPTCSVVHLKFDTDSWRDIGNKKGNLVFHQFPKNFKNSD